MRNVELLWEILPTRKDGSPFDIVAEVDNVELSSSNDGGATFSVLRNIAPNAPQTVVETKAAGDYIFRLVVVDTDGLRSDATDISFTVVNDVPSGVTNVIVRFDTPLA